ncbi:hypothetical protein NB311A_05153 [Nitrobacter sp. Nb-311A]|nr:hypothetical protein NB311A_05153 [Nitrobacter sp. Nb-311A]
MSVYGHGRLAVPADVGQPGLNSQNFGSRLASGGPKVVDRGATAAQGVPKARTFSGYHILAGKGLR